MGSRRSGTVLLAAMMALTFGTVAVPAAGATSVPKAPNTIIAGGGSWSCALLGNHTATCWGNNSYGSTGDGKVGDGSDRLTPVPVKGISTAVSITMSCALLANGTAKCWGENFTGEVGDGTTHDRFAPVAVKGLTHAVAIASSYQNACAVMANGTAKCWGQNQAGGVGDGTIANNRLTPVAVSGITNAVAIATRNEHSCALLANKTVKCWGYDDSGQIGNGHSGDSELTPVTVTGLTNVVAISLADSYSCAVLSNKTVKCWGASPTGASMCGFHNPFRCDTTPAIRTGLTNVIALSSGNAHSCALLVSRLVKCWGGNGAGQLGDGTRTSRQTPVAVHHLTNAVAVAAGGGHSCAWLSNGTVKCWGSNNSGQLGNGTTVDRLGPHEVTGL